MSQREINKGYEVPGPSMVCAANALAVVAFANDVLLAFDGPDANAMVGRTEELLMMLCHEAITARKPVRAASFFLAANELSDQQGELPAVVTLADRMQTDAIALRQGSMRKSSVVDLY